MKLIISIDKIKSMTEIKEQLAKIIINYDNEILKNKDTNIDVDINIDGNKSCCIPSTCISNCKSCDSAIVDVNTSITLPETDAKKCCIIM